MKNLIKIIENINKIKEGGNAVKNVGRIQLNEVKPTLKEIEKQILIPLGISLDEVGILGSTGKKESSGDIDLSIKLDMNEQELYEKVSTIVDYDVTLLKGIDIVSVAFPIYDESGKTDKAVQVDLMRVENIDYSKFSYYSPYSDTYDGELG